MGIDDTWKQPLVEGVYVVSWSRAGRGGLDQWIRSITATLDDMVWDESFIHLDRNSTRLLNTTRYQGQRSCLKT